MEGVPVSTELVWSALFTLSNSLPPFASFLCRAKTYFFYFPTQISEMALLNTEWASIKITKITSRIND
jgi:hypothetical protein